MEPEKIERSVKAMESALVKTGIDVIGDVPWGTHFSQFYQTKQDLLDILIPYFRAGLENNEFCMWVIAEPLDEEEARAAITKAMPDFAGYLARGHIEILPHTEWHLKDGIFDGQRVLNGWVDKLNQALTRGYAGMRVAGNTFWLEKKGWKDFTDYEAEVNSVIGKYKMLALCAYSLDKCSASEVIDVINNHQFVLLKKQGKWEAVENPERKRAREALEVERQQFNDVLDMLPAYLVLLTPDYHVPFANRFFRERFGESHGRRCFEYLFGRTEPCEACETYKVLKTMSPLEWEWTGPDGRNYFIYDYPFTDANGSTLIMEVGIDITKQKETQSEMQVRTAQQAVIARLGQMALAGADLDELFHEAVKQIAQTLKVEYCKVLKLLLGEKELLLLAGVGWKEGLVGRATVGAGIDSQAGYTLLSDKPVIVEDLRTEKRFNGPPLLHEHGVVSGMSVIIPGQNKPFGVLGAHTAGSRRFTEDDVHFLQAAANVLAGTIERKRAEEALLKAHNELEARVEERTRELGEANRILQAEIAERKLAGEALLREKDFSNAVIDNLPGFFYIVDRSGYFVRCNKDAEKATGYLAAEELPGMYCLNIIAEKDRDFITGKIEEVFTRGYATAEANLLTKGGIEIPYYFTGTSVAIGNNAYLLGMGINVAERKQAEEKLQETQNYLNNLLNYANAPIIVWDPSFRITRFNHAFERLTGLSADEVIGRQLDILFPENEREESMGYIRRALAGERWEVVEIPILRKDGTVRTVLWNSATLYGEDGKTAIATIAQGQDITERKQAEEELQETQNYLNNLLNYANAPIIVWDPSFCITRFNHAFERLTELSADQVIGRQLDSLFPESEREESMGYIRRALAGERWEAVEIPILRKDGTVRTVLWNSATLYGADGKTVATIAQGQDITERKQAEEEVMRLNRALVERAAELEAANKELEAFSYSVSHDLREPLRTIDGFSRILQKDYADKFDAEGQRFINIIRGGTNKMAQLISDLLAFSRIGRKEMQLLEIDMGGLAEAVSAELRSAVPERKLRFNFKSLPSAQGDPAMIRQVWANLLSNAIKFTRKKRLAVIEVGGLAQDGDNIYYVKDNGVGFEPQYKDKLFRIFQRLHTEEEFEGTGVGLAIIQRIIHRHGGRVWAESRVGRGATFYFTLPGKEGESL